MNNFGEMFRVSIFGESHGETIGCLLDGVPAGIELSVEDLLADIARRKSGAKGTTPRVEDDLPEIVSGVFQGKTTGAPIAIHFHNNNTKSKDYSQFLDMPRPGHADFVAAKKYAGCTDHRGGGHFSGRLTLPIVAAGAVAKKFLGNVVISAKVTMIGGSENIEETLDKAIENQDSVGGIIECSTDGLAIGLGEPFFDSAESLISHAVFSVPGIKGIEFGNGFSAAEYTGSENNDPIIDKDGTTSSNNCGGINGGITNGNQLFFSVAVKPTATINVAQQTYNFSKSEMDELKVEGRHDLAFVLRVPVVIEAMTAIVLADLSFRR